MKKIILSLGLLLAGTWLFAQEVPHKVRDQFHRDYPNASAMNWNRVNEKWNANFRDHGNDITACYDTKGHRIDSRMPIAQSAVPDKLIHRLRDRYPGERTHSFTKIDRPHKRDLYKVRITQQGMTKNIYMDKNGHERDYVSR